MVENKAIAEWLNRIEKELPQGKDLSDWVKDYGLYKSNGIAIQEKKIAAGFLPFRPWRITAKSSSNVGLLNGLSHGAEAIFTELSSENLDLLDNVQLDIIDSVIISAFDKDSHRHSQLKSYNTKAVMVQNIYHVFSNDDDTYYQFFQAVKREVAEDHDVNVVVQYHFENEFYKTINSLRAMRIVMANLNAALGKKSKLSVICCPQEHHKDFNRGLIYYTMGAMACIIGGTDYIYLMDWNHNHEEARLMQNILLLLRHEGRFDAYSDPTAGSYYFEQATNQIVEKTWKKLLS